MKKILVAEDELAISRVLSAYLQREGFEVLTAYDGTSALEQFFSHSPQLVILDIMMPGMDGWSVLEKIREKSACPVIMLTALGDIDYKLKGLNTGADDYISKPFIGDEVIARVNAVLRRSANVYTDEHIKQYGSLTINFNAHTIFLNGKEVSLTPRDLSLLLFLAERPNRTFTRDQLIEHVWGMDYDGSDRAVDLAVKRIRQALTDWPETEGEIRTLRGMGYQFHVYEK
ncbi:response regulator transcription factor [Cytobacillus oceanisediminis]|jgi:DNA-binding response OmpR family regulator|uniref:response regulator transcription factor n=1 Tax=Cytobacillus TaxID=2675230 RepID=UPI00203EBDFD|nr:MULTISPECIES: response regulator transcription factor [Cytobacillus]MBY0155115.1 response regulator transcription factor [Cytobacillus firmus]MCM3393413.1 response regulator transcription factor [Cytobacillus oceanisediminis]MCM3530511.1 response regulator transcription factor [Cytobacillus oceanisediminis]UQX54840.1 response regulator transcription factor [Cytobacillus pseudoceanisediminis]